MVEAIHKYPLTRSLLLMGLGLLRAFRRQTVLICSAARPAGLGRPLFLFLLLLPVAQLGLDLVNEFDAFVELHRALPAPVGAVFQARPDLGGGQIGGTQLAGR